MMILKEFSRIVCVSLFSYQGSLLVCLTDSLFTLPHLIDCVKYFFEVFYFFKIQNLKRRRRDLNPRAAINDLLPFQGSPFGQLGYFSKLPYAIASFFQKRFILYRVVFYLSRTFLTFQKFLFSSNSGESGIRTHAPLRTNGFQDRLVMTTSISLHIHFSVFATSLSDARCILSSNLFDVNTNFYIFSIFFKNTSATSRSSGVVILIF